MIALMKKSSRRRAFTLVELLVVLVIVGIVSAATIPVVVPMFNHRKVSEAARLVQATLMGARDAAVRANAPRGVRLLPDPQFSGPAVLAANRMIPIEPAPDYNEGLVTIFADDPANGFVGNLPVLPADKRISINEAVFDKDPSDPTAIPNSPTNWYWNIRQGDQIRFDDSGRYYTIAGPMTIGPINSTNKASASGANPERYINAGAPGTPSPDLFTKGYKGGERLYLVNGQDDDGDGWVDESFDGIDNDGDGITDPGFNGLDDNNNGTVDEPAELMIGVTPGAEYEPEQFIGSQLGATFSNKPYTIIRRPVVTDRALEIALPEGVVIDLTTWNAPMARDYTNPGLIRGSKPERSRLPVDPYSYYVDIMLMPNGQVLLPGGGTGATNSGGASPLSSSPFYHFWIAEREDLFAPLFGNIKGIPDPKTGVQIPSVPIANPLNTGGGTPTFLLPMPEGTSGYDPSGVAQYNKYTKLLGEGGATSDAFLKGDRRLVTIFTKTGRIVTNEIESFNAANTDIPYYGAQLGTREVK